MQDRKKTASVDPSKSWNRWQHGSFVGVSTISCHHSQGIRRAESCCMFIFGTCSSLAICRQSSKVMMQWLAIICWKQIIRVQVSHIIRQSDWRTQWHTVCIQKKVFFCMQTCQNYKNVNGGPHSNCSVAKMHALLLLVLLVILHRCDPIRRTSKFNWYHFQGLVVSLQWLVLNTKEVTSSIAMCNVHF